MKKNALFDRCAAQVSPEVKEEVNLNVDIANRICDLLKAKKMTQRAFAALMGRHESEISRWLTGTHGFTTATLARIAVILGEPVVEVKRKSGRKYVFVPVGEFVTPSEISKGCDVHKNGGDRDCYRVAYSN